jgi:branched-chain amino acid aminotransferase
METSRYIWMDGDLVSWEDARVHVLSHALHYGTAVFEGIRAYQTADGAGIFRLTDHMNRLRFSAKAYGLPLEHSTDQLCKAAREVMAVNELDEAYLRPLVYLGLGSIGLNPFDAATHVTIAAWKWGAYLGEDGVHQGIRAKVSSWRRIDAAMLIPAAKGSGGYLNSVLAKAEALRAGVDEAIMLNADGMVVEGSGENIFLVHAGRVRTPPGADGILEGITRNSLMTLLTDAGHDVEEVSITRAELYRADEVFLCGTAAEVTPVREIDDRPVGDGTPGPVTRQAQELFSRAVRGELDRYRDWVESV